MQKFTDIIAKQLVSSEIPLNKRVIVLPSERAKQYIQKSLFEAVGKAVLAPKMLTINHWISSLSEQTVLDKTSLLLRLFEIHQSYPGEEIDKSFDEFLNWGNILLNDFDEIDRYLLDSKMLFRNLRDIKEIENWSFDSEKELTENQKKYLLFWERLPFYFEKFQQLLAKENACLMGSVYRNVAENINLVFQKDKEIHFIFAGFNALSLAEMSIFRQLHRLGRAEILFDTDSFYLNDKNHEAGQFIRKFTECLNEKSLPEIRNELSTGSKKIELISCAQATGQVKVAGTILAALSQEELNETLVLLADETLIIPLLQNIPKSVGKANITLGLPLRASALLTWLDLLFTIQEGFLRYNRVSVYYKDLLNLWNHPFIQEILSEQERSLIYTKEKEIRSRNIIFQSPKKVTVSAKMDEILLLLYTPWENSWSKAMSCIRKLNQHIYSGLGVENEFERAIIQRFDEVIVDFQNAVNTSFPEMSLRSFKLLFNQEWSRESIAYYGNPIDGLQIMGLLETRLLDFKRILVIGFNEGKMPPANPIQSLIPMDLRAYMGLPLPREKQGLFAHHFYRLLHACEEMTITYHNGAEGLGFAEKSRYIAQLELELAKQNLNISFSNRDYSLLREEQQVEKKSVPKTPEILQQLDEIFSKGVSVSMLKSYFRCPLDFYYQYVLRFGEEQKVEEELESNTFGILIHEVLEDLYQPFNLETHDEENKVRTLKEKDVDVMLLQFRSKLFDAFKRHFNGDEQAFQTGKNYLSYSMSLELTEQFLKSEKRFLKEHQTSTIYIQGLEKSLSCELELEIFEQKKPIKLKGFVDRIDLLDGAIRILDYKTGKVELKDVADDKPNFAGTDLDYLIKLCKESKHFFQLLTYVYLYHQNYGVMPAESAIISFVSFRNNPFKMKARELTNEELCGFYPEILSAILEEIYDPSTPFEHVEKEPNFCAYC